LFFLDDDGVLFSEPRQELHRLNTAGAIIWCHMVDGLDEARIAARLQADQGLDEATASEFVAAALADWRALGLLDGFVPPAVTAAPAAAEILPPYPSAEPAFVAERHYALAGVTLRYRFTDAAHAAQVHPVLAHLASGPGDGPTLDVVGSERGVALYRDREPCSPYAAPDELVPMAKHLAWSSALRGRAFLLDIHAGVVACRGAAVLLPAPPGSGKSTLTAALVHAGFQFFSDEVALLQADFSVRPFPLALCVKDTGLAAMAPLFPEVLDLPLHRRGDGKRVAYLPPRRASLPQPTQGCPVRSIIFPRYQAGAPTSCRKLARAEALQRLLGQCLIVAGHLDAATVRRLVGWVASVPCAELVYDALSEAVAAVALSLDDVCRPRGDAAEQFFAGAM
jgi:hypothetical protein